MSATTHFLERHMILSLMGAGDEPETTIRVKLWPVLMLVISAVVFLFIQHSNHESRICVAEKQTQAVTEKVAAVETTIEKMYREQDLYFSLREPRWQEWKKWAEKNKGADK